MMLQQKHPKEVRAQALQVPRERAVGIANGKAWTCPAYLWGNEEAAVFGAA